MYILHVCIVSDLNIVDLIHRFSYLCFCTWLYSSHICHCGVWTWLPCTHTHTSMSTESPEKSFNSGQILSSPNKRVGVKRERDKEVNPESATDQLSSAPSHSNPPLKKQKVEHSPSTITEEEVEYYLSRRPITSKDLVRKFTSKKMEMDKKKVVSVLHQIIRNLRNLDKKVIKGKMFLSLKPSPPQWECCTVVVILTLSTIIPSLPTYLTIFISCFDYLLSNNDVSLLFVSLIQTHHSNYCWHFSNPFH